MNITSISSQELYKIMTGQDVPTMGRIKEDANESDVKKAIDTASKTKNCYDLFQLTEEYKANVDTSSVTSLFNNSGYEIGLNWIQNNKELTMYFTDIAKRLDAAYAKGKFTEDEYNQLNDGLKDYIVSATEKWDIGRAQKREWQERHPMMRRDYSSNNISIWRQSDDEAKRKQDEINKAVEVILNKTGFRNNIKKMLDMINQYRKDPKFVYNTSTPEQNPTKSVVYEKMNVSKAEE